MVKEEKFLNSHFKAYSNKNKYLYMNNTTSRQTKTNNYKKTKSYWLVCKNLTRAIFVYICTQTKMFIFVSWQRDTTAACQ